MSELTMELTALAGGWQVVETDVVGAAAKTIVVATANPLRWAIMFNPSTTGGTVTLSTNPNVKPGHGMQIVLDGPPIILSYRQVGGLVQVAWYGVNVAGGAAEVIVTEILAIQ